MNLERTLPSSREAEQAIIGALVYSPHDAATVIRDRITEETLYFAAHKVIFREACALLDGLKALDMITLTDRLSKAGNLEDVGGGAYLADLVSNGSIAALNLESHIEIVEDDYERRRKIQLATELLANSYDRNIDLDTLNETISKHVQSAGIRGQDLIPMRVAVKEAVRQIETIISSDRHITGLTTGFEKIDEFTHGLNAPDVWVVAARPSGGKPAFLVTVAENAARLENVAVGIISMEQNSSALAKRALAGRSRVNMRALRASTPEQQQRITAAATEMMRLPIFFDERPALTIRQIRSTGRKMVARHGCKLICLDYLQLAQADEKTDKRNDEVAKISAGCKAMAKELNVPVILLAQLNRSSVIGNRRPTPADLRDSGAIEQDADLVGFLNTDLKDEELPKTWRGQFSDEERAKIVQFDIAKQREGDQVAAYLLFEREFTRFSNLQPPQPRRSYQE